MSDLGEGSSIALAHVNIMPGANPNFQGTLRGVTWIVWEKLSDLHKRCRRPCSNFLAAVVLGIARHVIAYTRLGQRESKHDQSEMELTFTDKRVRALVCRA